MSVSTSFDLLLRGGRVIDPASGVDVLKDVAVRDGKIAVVQSDVLPSSTREVVDVTGKIVLRGLIEMSCAWLCFEILHPPVSENSR